MWKRMWIPVLAASALGAGCASRQKTEDTTASMARTQQEAAMARQQAGASEGGQAAGQQAYIRQLEQKAACEERRAEAALQRLQEQEQQLAELQEQQQEGMEQEGAMGGGGQQAQAPQVLPVPGGVLFFSNSAELMPAAEEPLSEVVAALEAAPDATVRLEGHTDGRGEAAYNTQLSERRAQAVRDFLVQQGVEEARIQAEGRGASEPVASNDNEAGRAMNRRVDISVESGQGTGGSGLPSAPQENVPPEESDPPSDMPLIE